MNDPPSLSVREEKLVLPKTVDYCVDIHSTAQPRYRTMALLYNQSLTLRHPYSLNGAHYWDANRGNKSTKYEWPA